MPPKHQTEPETAKCYVRQRISIQDDQTIVIDMKAGRGENGYSATLDIVATAGMTAVPIVALNTLKATALAAPFPSVQPLATVPVKTLSHIQARIQEDADQVAEATGMAQASEGETYPEEGIPLAAEAAVEPDAVAEPNPQPVKPKSIFSKAV